MGPLRRTAPSSDAVTYPCSQLWSFLGARKKITPLRQRWQSYYTPLVTPSQKLLVTGITSSHNMARGWEHFLGIWKLFKSPSAETGILMDPQLYNIKLKRHNFLISRIIVLCMILLLFRVFFSTEKANSLLLQNISLLSIFCTYYTQTSFT